jgi:probable rRNA maturation factor
MAYEIEVEFDDPFLEAIDVENLQAAVAATLRHAGIEEGVLTVVVTDDESVRTLNQQYRNIDAPTDVLSFSAQEGDDLADLPPELLEEMGDYLGDLIIAYPYTAAQAGRYGHSIAAELRLLVVHGTLHLLGYDHDTPENQQVMWNAQRQVLTQLGDESTDWEREPEE